MWVRRDLGRIEHLILAALLANGLDATAVEAKKHSKSKQSKSDSTETETATTPSTSGSAAAPAATPASPPAATPATSAAATPAAPPAATPAAAAATSAPAPAPAAPAKASAGSGTAAAPIAAPPAPPPPNVSPSVLSTPRTDSSSDAPAQTCYVPRKVFTFKEEALIVPGPATQRWNAGRVMYGLGTGLSMAATGIASIGGIIVAAGGSTASLSDPGPAMSLAGNVGNITGTALLISGLAAQHSALGMLGKDSGRAKFIAGVVFGALGLASVGAGYIVGGLDVPNKDIINYSVGYGGTLLLTTASSILISDARNLRQIWDALGMRPGVQTPYPAPPAQPPPPRQQ